MTVNPDKFQTKALEKHDKNSQTNSLNIDNKTIETTKQWNCLVLQLTVN